MRRIVLFFMTIMVLCSSVLLVSCNKDEENADKQTASEDEQVKKRVYTLSIFLPNSNEEKWIRCIESFEEICARWDYSAEFLIADDDAKAQLNMLNDAIDRKTDCIIFAAIDSYDDEILPVLEKASDYKIPVIALDRLVMNTENIDCFVTFDQYLAGRSAAEYLMKAMTDNGLQSAYNIEVLLGSRTNDSARYFYSGVFDYLIPYIKSGNVVIGSGRNSFEQATADSDASHESRARELLAAVYSGETKLEGLDGIIAMDDDIALGAISALQKGSYGRNGKLPVVTGAGCYAAGIESMKAGSLRMSIFEDEKVLVEEAMRAADLLVHNSPPEATDKTTFFNGAEVVKAVVCLPIVVDNVNYDEILAAPDE